VCLSLALKSAQHSWSLPPKEEHLPQLSLFELVYEQQSSIWPFSLPYKVIHGIVQVMEYAKMIKYGQNDVISNIRKPGQEDYIKLTKIWIFYAKITQICLYTYDLLIRWPIPFRNKLLNSSHKSLLVKSFTHSIKIWFRLIERFWIKKLNISSLVKKTLQAHNYLWRIYLMKFVKKLLAFLPCLDFKVHYLLSTVTPRVKTKFLNHYLISDTVK
jgi:hypothetical protein